jgi:biopolymer transport protein ExbD
MVKDDGEHGFQMLPMLVLTILLFPLLFLSMAVSGPRVERELPIHIPVQTFSQGCAPQPFIITIDEVGNVMMNNHPMGTPDDDTLGAMRKRLKDVIDAMGAESVPVLIVPAENATYQRVIDVLSACNYAKVRTIHFRGVGFYIGRELFEPESNEKPID